MQNYTVIRDGDTYMPSIAKAYRANISLLGAGDKTILAGALLEAKREAGVTWWRDVGGGGSLAATNFK